MAEQNAQDRNLPASQRKLDKAREEGNLPRSQDLGHFAAMAVGGSALVVMGPDIAQWTQELVASGLRFNAQTLSQPDVMLRHLAALALKLVWIVVPMGLLMVLNALATNLLVGGWNFALSVLQPKFSGLNPLTGWSRVFNKKTFVTAVKGAFLAILLGIVGGLYLKASLDDFNSAWGMALPAGLIQVSNTVVGGLMLLLLVLAVFAAIDAPLQKKMHAARLKMSHQEVKQEHKEVEGNAEVKSKIKVRMRELSRRRMLAAVPQADLVVMNPTHYAVALKYEEGKMGAPRVVAKGADLLAMAIRDLAKSSQVPVLQAPVLARALYAHAELDREVPAALFAAVAQVLAYVYQLRAALAGQAPMPPELSPLPVPPELDPHNKPASAGHEDDDGTIDAGP
ncbi:MAG: flagellar type III secretion system protein FlhB [Pseudomonadota bacterium]